MEPQTPQTPQALSTPKTPAGVTDLQYNALSGYLPALVTKTRDRLLSVAIGQAASVVTTAAVLHKHGLFSAIVWDEAVRRPLGLLVSVLNEAAEDKGLKGKDRRRAGSAAQACMAYLTAEWEAMGVRMEPPKDQQKVARSVLQQLADQFMDQVMGG